MCAHDQLSAIVVHVCVVSCSRVIQSTEMPGNEYDVGKTYTACQSVAGHLLSMPSQMMHHLYQIGEGQGGNIFKMASPSLFTVTFLSLLSTL